MKFENQEAFLLWLIHFFSSKFKNHSILKGGMVLRLLDCPRMTNDVDFVFVPYHSKNDILEMVLEELKSIPNLEWSHSMHSKMLRIRLELGGQKALVEINVAEECKSMPMSTAELSRLHHQNGGIVRVMDLSLALAHKCAAWNERRLVRDLYDIWFLHKRARAPIHIQSLEKRLSKIESRVKGIPKSMSLLDFASTLSQELKRLTDEKIQDEMSGLLAPEELIGLSKKITTGLGSLIEEVEGHRTR